MSMINLIYSYILFKQGTKCYLTARGVIAINRIFKENCRFVIEEELNDNGYGNKYVSVYAEKNPCPHKFRIIEREEEVIQLVKSF